MSNLHEARLQRATHPQQQATPSRAHVDMILRRVRHCGDRVHSLRGKEAEVGQSQTSSFRVHLEFLGAPAVIYTNTSKYNSSQKQTKLRLLLYSYSTPRINPSVPNPASTSSKIRSLSRRCTTASSRIDERSSSCSVNISPCSRRNTARYV